ncbi:MAG: CIA30 family protein [Alishewanella aestuarii]
MKLSCFFCLYVLGIQLFVSSVASSADVVLIDRFDQEPSAFHTRWQLYNDAGAGGDSRCQQQSTSSHVLEISGHFGQKFGYPFCGLRTFLNNSGTPIDASAYKGIQIRYKAQYNFTLQVLTAPVTDYNEFSAELPASQDWVTKDVLFSQFAQSPYFGKQVDFAASKVRGLGVHITGLPGQKFPPVYIDSISFIH